MKNLKRVLSLALSGVMLVGMMAMGASAVNASDFSDAENITHTEAVSIATALSIIDGKDDGSFDPNGNVTRGEMAKMITRAMFGGDDPVLGKKSVPTFTDIQGRWDEEYIEYCANEGIINGRGDGTFDPTGNVTGTEAAKMLLVALGYKADIYGLTGIDWAVTTNSIANRTDVALYDELKGLDPNVAFTRDQVAQMIYNALNANTREMNPTMEITGNGDITYQYTDSKKTLLYDKYGAVRVEGVVTGNEFTDNSTSMEGKTRVAISNEIELANMLIDADTDTLGAYGSPRLDVSSGKDEFGRAVIVYVKPSATSKKDLSKGTVICEILLDEDNNTVISRTKKFPDGDYADGAKKTLNDWLDDNGLELPTTGATRYTNYGNSDTVTTTSAASIFNVPGEEYIAIDNNDDGEVEIILHNTSAFGQVTKWDEKNEKVTVKSNGTSGLYPNNEDMADVVAYDDIAEDDWVNCTKVDKTWYITKSETVTGDLDDYDKVTDIAKDSGTTLTVDGEEYVVAYAASGVYTDGDVDDITLTIDKNALDEEITLYLDAFGYAIACICDVANEFLYVGNASWSNTAYSQSSGALTAYVYFEDGTAGSYIVDEIDEGSGYRDAKQADALGQNGTSICGKIWKYSLNSKDELKLVKVTNTAATGTVEYKKGQSTVTGTSSGLITNDTVVFFVTLKDMTAGYGKVDKVRVYTGKNSPSVKNLTVQSAAISTTSPYEAFGTYMAYVLNDNGTDMDAAVFASDTTAGSDWVFLIDYVKTNSDGDVYNAIVDGDLAEINLNEKLSRTEYENVAFDYDMDGDLYDLGGKSQNVKVGNVALVDSDSLVLDDGTEFDITSSTVTAYLDSDDTDVGAKISKKDTVYVIYNNSSDMDAEGIFILAEADDTEAEIVYFDVDKITGEGTSASRYVVDLSDYSATPSTSGDLAAVKGAFTISGGATMKLVADNTTTTTYNDVKTASEITDGSVVAGNYKLIVMSESLVSDDDTAATSGYTVYYITVQA